MKKTLLAMSLSVGGGFTAGRISAPVKESILLRDELGVVKTDATEEIQKTLTKHCKSQKRKDRCEVEYDDQVSVN